MRIILTAIFSKVTLHLYKNSSQEYCPWDSTFFFQTPRFYLNTNRLHTQAVNYFLHYLGTEFGNLDGQLSCSFHDGSSVLGGNTGSNLCMIRIAAPSCSSSSLALWIGEATGQHVLCAFLFIP